MLLADDLAAALDPVRLARRMGLEPDPWQARVLRSRAPRLSLNCSRQVGKSTVTSVLAAHVALYEPGALTLLVSPSERQSIELLRKVKAGLGALGERPNEVEKDNVLGLELAHGGRVLALPGKEGTIRGFSGVRLMVIDEASRVPDATYRAVRPMLATSGGRLVALSTPFGKRGWWWQAWASAEDWDRYEVRAEECPRIPASFLAEEREALGIFYEQEYGCRFLDTTNALISGDDIDAMISADAAPFFLEG